MNEKKDFKQFLCSSAGKVGMIIFFYAAIWGIFLLWVGVMEDMRWLAFAYLGLYAYFGWKALDRITPNIFLIMPIIGWVIYILVKGALAFIVGMFIAPFKFAKKITEMIQKKL